MTGIVRAFGHFEGLLAASNTPYVTNLKANMIREVTTNDVDTALDAARDCGLFAAEELIELRAQLERSLSGASDRDDFWLADFDADGRAIGVALCAEEQMTDRTWNLLFIGVRQASQSEGIGSGLLQKVESRLRESSQRLLVIETTNGDDFENTRRFYRKHGYTEEGTVRDFYAAGFHKITFRKTL